MEKRGWITWFTWKTNKFPRQGICATYVGRRRPPVLPKERRHWGLPGQILEAQAKLVGLTSLHAPDGNSAIRWEKERHEETSLSRNWSVSLFSRSAFILWVIHRDKWRIQSHTGSAVLTLIETTLFFCIPSNIQSSQLIYIIFWPRGLLTFYDLFWWWLVNQKTYFLQRWLFLSQAPPSEGTR